jgi:hypothetical protein
VKIRAIRGKKSKFKINMYLCGINNLMIMIKSIENKGITATVALKNEVAGKTKPLFGLAKTSHTAETLYDMVAKIC